MGVSGQRHLPAALYPRENNHRYPLDSRLFLKIWTYRAYVLQNLLSGIRPRNFNAANINGNHLESVLAIPHSHILNLILHLLLCLPNRRFLQNFVPKIPKCQTIAAFLITMSGGLHNSRTFSLCFVLRSYECIPS
jgi:hypothetical protein